MNKYPNLSRLISARRGSKRVFTILLSVLFLLPVVKSQDPLSESHEKIVQPDQNIVVDETVWPYFNWASFDQDKVVSFGHFQYTIFWDADKVLVFVRRNLQNNSIQTLRFPSYTLTINPKDGHRNIVLGVSPEDGRIHLSWDHHNNDLRYTKSRKNFLINPPKEISLKDFEPAQPLTAEAPQRVTYPRFLNDGKGRLYFIYRSGGSGNGRNVFARYSAKAGTWQVSAGRLFDSEGVFPPWENSSSRNAYLNNVLFDDNDRLHITWVYREVSSTWASNHDLHYCYSDDYGTTWMNNNGVKIADLSENDAIDIDDPGIVVQQIPVFSWLMNQCAMSIDSQNQPHVALYRLPYTYKPIDLKHNPPHSVTPDFRYYHYWRDKKNIWRSSGPLPMFEGRDGHMRRPEIIIDKDDNVMIYWSDKNKGFYCYLATASDNWKTTSLIRLTTAQFAASTSKHDRRLLEDEGVLSFTANPMGESSGSGFAILDFDVKKILQMAGLD